MRRSHLHTSMDVTVGNDPPRGIKPGGRMDQVRVVGYKTQVEGQFELWYVSLKT